MFLDGYMSDSQKEVESALSNIIDYQREKILNSPVLVKLGVTGQGNLTEAQLKAGQRGSTEKVQTDNTSNGDLSRSNGFGMVSDTLKKYGIPIGIGLGIIAIVMLVKRK